MADKDKAEKADPTRVILPVSGIEVHFAGSMKRKELKAVAQAELQGDTDAALPIIQRLIESWSSSAEKADPDVYDDMDLRDWGALTKGFMGYVQHLMNPGN